MDTQTYHTTTLNTILNDCERIPVTNTTRIQAHENIYLFVYSYNDSKILRKSVIENIYLPLIMNIVSGSKAGGDK